MRGQSRSRAVIYVCSAIRNDELISKMIEAATIDDAYMIFDKQFKIKPQTVLGPFYKKKANVIDKNAEVRFKFGPSKQGIYNNWYITAMPLVSPTDCMYVLYNSRTDGQKIKKPKATIVKITDIQEMV